MAHEIWGSKFYSDRSKPAWHGIDLLRSLNIEHDETDRTAEQILTLMGNPKVREIPLELEYNGYQLPITHKAIVSDTDNDEKPYQQIGVVGIDWELINPQSASKLWDAEVGQIVDTMAFIRGGRELFITGKLPSFSAGADDIDNYIVFFNPMDGGKTAQAYTTSIRVVCANTLRWSMETTRSSFRISHFKGSHELLGKWMGNTYQSALASQQIVKEATEWLQKKSVSDEVVEDMALKLYPIPNEPDWDKPRKSPRETVERWHNYRVERNESWRDEVLKLFKGEGKGANLSFYQGTAWGAFNAVSELETYRKGSFLSASGAMLGDGERGKSIRKAHEYLLEV